MNSGIKRVEHPTIEHPTEEDMASPTDVTNEEMMPAAPRRRMPYTRQRSLREQISMLILRPNAFFRAMPTGLQTRQWLWVAILVLVLISAAAVRQFELAEAPAPAAMDFSSEPVFDGGGMPPDMGIPPGGGDVAPQSSIQTWSAALIAGATLLLHWFVQALLLCGVTLFNGRAPRLGRNFQIAVWASVPLALMAVLQLVYFATGGQPGAAGLSGLLDALPDYATLPDILRAALISLAANTTIFWLWNMALLVIGARRVLRGNPAIVGLMLVSWVLLLTFVPVLTGQIDGSLADDHGDMMPIDMMPGEMPIDGAESGDFAIEEIPGDAAAEEGSPSEMPLEETEPGQPG